MGRTQVRMDIAQREAEAKCNACGYTGAEAFGGSDAEIPSKVG